MDTTVERVVIASCYRYPKGHHDRAANEDFIDAVMAWSCSLTAPSIVVGDMNDHPSTSLAMMRATALGMQRLNDNASTTLTKDGAISNRLSLDHRFANTHAWNLGIRVKVDHALRISDHLPMILDYPCVGPTFLQVVWPSVSDPLGPKRRQGDWTARPHTYEE